MSQNKVESIPKIHHLNLVQPNSESTLVQPNLKSTLPYVWQMNNPCCLAKESLRQDWSKMRPKQGQEIIHLV